MRLQQLVGGREGWAHRIGYPSTSRRMSAGMISSGAFAIVARALAGAGAGCATRTGAASTATISALLGGLKLSSQGGVAHARSGLLEIPHHRRWSSSAMRPPATAAGSPSPGGDGR